MGLGKSFLLSLVAFVGLNFIFTIIYYLVVGFDNLITTIQSAPLMILYYLFGAVVSTPLMLLEGTIIQPLFFGDLSFLVIGLGFLVSSLVAALLAGKFAESKLQGFGGWGLTVIVSTIAIFIGTIPGLSDTLVATVNSYYGSTGFEMTLLYLVLSGLINIIFYGFFSLLVSKTEYY
ncbi:MAG: hypothetical protein ACFFEN_06285 [Candidatus Thorarchaeota archaeon]